MRLYRITDYIEALSIVRHPAIEDVIHEDGSDRDEIPNIIDEYWMGSELDGKLIGCFRLTPRGKSLYQVHTMFIPGYRRHVIEAKNLFGKWCIDNLFGFQKMFAMVPCCFQNVINHALAIGFVQEGCIAKAYNKNDKLEDIVILSINKEQIKENI